MARGKRSARGPRGSRERRGRGRRSKDMEEIAGERMEVLMEEAARAVRADKGDRARRYVDLARKIGMRHNVPMARSWKRWVCAGCGTFLLPGRNASARVRPERTVVRCLECGQIKRVGHRTAPKPPG